MYVGEIFPYSGSTTPTNCLVCNGQAVSRSTYADLYEAIGTIYGQGDGSTTFNLPDFSGRVALGASASFPMACKGGQSTVALNTNQIPAHNHTIPAHGHGHTIVAKTPSLSHSITQAKFTYTQLNGTADDAQSGSSNYYNGRTSSAMTRSASLAVANHAATACTMGGSIADKAAYTSGSTGSGSAHNNLMPYLALTYLICATSDEPTEDTMAIYNGAMPVTTAGSYLV